MDQGTTDRDTDALERDAGHQEKLKRLLSKYKAVLFAPSPSSQDAEYETRISRLMDSTSYLRQADDPAHTRFIAFPRIFWLAAAASVLIVAGVLMNQYSLREKPSIVIINALPDAPRLFAMRGGDTNQPLRAEEMNSILRSAAAMRFGDNNVVVSNSTTNVILNILETGAHLPNGLSQSYILIITECAGSTDEGVSLRLYDTLSGKIIGQENMTGKATSDDLKKVAEQLLHGKGIAAPAKQD